MHCWHEFYQLSHTQHPPLLDYFLIICQCQRGPSQHSSTSPACPDPRMPVSHHLVTVEQNQALLHLPQGQLPPSHPPAWGSGPYLMTLKVLCSKRAAGVGRLRAKACFKVSMLRLQSSASFSNLLRRHCSGPWPKRLPVQVPVRRALT